MRAFKVLSVFCYLAAITFRSDAVEVTNVPEVGPHQPILVVEKNVNPQNKLVVYTKLDGSGHFLTDASDRNRPVLDFYWLMSGRDYKPINRLIKSEIRKRFVSQWDSSDRLSHFVVKVNDLKEVNCDIEDPKVEVQVSENGGGLAVDAQMNLGPSDGNMRIRVSSIFTEGRAIPPSVESVTLRGDEIVNGNLTGKKVSRTYVARK